MPPLFLSVIISLVQALKEASLPIEPKKDIRASINTTAVAASNIFPALPFVINSVVPKRIVKQPQRIYPQATKGFLFPLRSDRVPNMNVEIVVAIEDTATIHEIIVGSFAILA